MKINKRNRTILEFTTGLGMIVFAIYLLLDFLNTPIKDTGASEIILMAFSFGVGMSAILVSIITSNDKKEG